MNEDATWYGSRPRPRPHCITRGPSSPRKGHSSPPFLAHVYDTEPVIQHLANANCKPHLLYGSEVIAWNSSDLSNITYAFNSAMCRIYHVSLKLLPTVYHYTGQSDISHYIVHRGHQFLSKCKFSNNHVIRYIDNRFP